MSALVLQTTASGPVRLGPTGDRLASEDIEAIAQVVSESAAKVWVLVGHGPPMVDSAKWFVDVYLEAGERTLGLRRGRMEVVVAALPSLGAYDTSKSWKKTSSAGYAQVLVPDRNPDIVRDGRDLNRPFRTYGDLSDDDLVNVVRFIRTSPTIPPASIQTDGRRVARIFADVQGDWPIDRVVRRDDGTLEVYLLDADPMGKSGQKIVLRRADKGWAITRLFAWAAD